MPGRLIALSSEADIVTARRFVRDLAVSLGFGLLEQVQVATAVSELARNVIQYAGEGEISIAATTAGERTGIEVVCRDHGPGIDDLARAMSGGYSSGGGLGRGLSGARRLFDDFEVKTAPGQGTEIVAVKWLT